MLACRTQDIEYAKAFRKRGRAHKRRDSGGREKCANAGKQK